jgi:ubiquitin-protein ligase
MNSASCTDSADPLWWENALRMDTCLACNGFYGPCFGEPVCSTCHAFLYASRVEQETNPQALTDEQNDLSDDCDSGNDEPSDYFPLDRGASNSNTPQVEGDLDERDVSQQQSPAVDNWNPSFRVETLGERLQLLVATGPADVAPPGLVERVPPEVLLEIFSFLDDISLLAAGNVCRRWRQVLTANFHSDRWIRSVERRWPLFAPMVCVKDWFSVFSTLVNSSFCLTCIYQMSECVNYQGHRSAIRSKRLLHDLTGLGKDALEGVMAKPLDSSLYHWQASIRGPVGSPYEGGLFYLYMKVPFLYPFDPPEVRFLTKIFHPNVSRHGDIGIDSIEKSIWVSALTLSKVLLSIQSLLTDPFCEVCMEQDIGDLYKQDKKTFEAVARSWTWKFAMLDVLPIPVLPGAVEQGAAGDAAAL